MSSSRATAFRSMSVAASIGIRSSAVLLLAILPPAARAQDSQIRDIVTASPPPAKRTVTPDEIPEIHVPSFSYTHPDSSRDSVEIRLTRELERQGFPPEEIQRRLEAYRREVEPVPGTEFPDSTAALPESLESAVRQAPVAATREIPIFGRDLFNRTPLTFAPPATGSAGPSYIVGAGDQLIVNMWGKTQNSYTVSVGREGDLALPEAGVLQVAGLSLADVEELVRRELSRYFTGIKVRVSVARVRSTTVYVVGEVTRPGAYTLSSLSTVIHALYAAGGPTDSGSLRRVRYVLRDGTAREVDFYHFLLKGDDSSDPRIEDGSTVFVPPIGPLVAIRGEVRRPARYELVGGETVDDLIMMAGGAPATAYLGRVALDRVFDGRERRLVDVYKEPVAGQAGFDTPLADGDDVTVFPILDTQINRLDLVGGVMMPGMYELRPGMRALDLIASGGGVRGDAYLPRAEVRRTRIDGTREIVGFDLGEALIQGATASPSLEPRDSVVVFAAIDSLSFPTVSIAGEVKSPGVFPLAAGMTIADLVSLGGGLNEDAYLDRAEVARVRPQVDKGGEGKIEVIGVSLVAEPGAGTGSAFELQQGDRVYVRAIPDLRPPQSVTLEGEVRFPGSYAILEEGETLSSVIARAGGITEECHLPGVSFERLGEGRVVVDADRLIRKHDRGQDIVLHEGDRIIFPHVPETVRVTGAVFRPGSIKYIPGKKAGYYVDRCGGALDIADAGGVRVIQPDGGVETLKSWWPDPTVKPGALIQVPIKTQEKTDWSGLFRDSAQTLASIVTVMFFTRELAK